MQRNNALLAVAIAMVGAAPLPALAQAEARVNARECYSLVLAGEDWHAGVLGIVASRVVEKFYRPTVVIGDQHA